MNELELRSIAQQVERLQQDNARIRTQMRRAIGCALGAGILVAGLAGAAFQQTGRFQKAIEITDANTRLRAVMYADDGNNKSGFELRDSQGRGRFSLRSNNAEDAFIHFYDAQGRVRIDLGIGPNGAAYFNLLDANGNVRHQFAAPL